MSKIGDGFEYTLIVSARTPILYTFDNLESDIDVVTERDVEFFGTEAYEMEVPSLYGYVHVNEVLNRYWFDPRRDIWTNRVDTD